MLATFARLLNIESYDAHEIYGFTLALIMHL